MHLQIDKVILHTKSISNLSQFVSQLFELSVEVNQLGQSFCDFGNMIIYFQENHEIKHIPQDSTNFVFKVSTLDELNAFQKKLEFYYYREAMDYKPTIEQSPTYSQLIFIDPDGRNWLLECPRAIQNLTQDSFTRV